MILKGCHCKAGLTLGPCVCVCVRALMCKFVQTDSQHEGCVMGHWVPGSSWKLLTFDSQAKLLVVFSFFLFGLEEVTWSYSPSPAGYLPRSKEKGVSDDCVSP